MGAFISMVVERRIFPLGDQALLVYLPDEQTAIHFAASVRQAGFPWLWDIVPAYASVGVYFDADRIRLIEVMEILQELPLSTNPDSMIGKLHIIPCCYEMQLDLDRVAQRTGLTPDTVIELHTSCEYTVYAIGFCPGFPYLGYLPEPLCGVPRLASPRIRIDPGSVGLTAKQTGLYPLARPGGWNLIGRTPLVVVDVEDGFFPIRVGDRVRFKRIDESEYRQLDGNRLS
jgi:inhibitor of KinA